MQPYVFPAKIILQIQQIQLLPDAPDDFLRVKRLGNIINGIKIKPPDDMIDVRDLVKARRLVNSAAKLSTAESP